MTKDCFAVLSLVQGSRWVTPLCGRSEEEEEPRDPTSDRQLCPTAGLWLILLWWLLLSVPLTLDHKVAKPKLRETTLTSVCPLLGEVIDEALTPACTSLDLEA